MVGLIGMVMSCETGEKTESENTEVAEVAEDKVETVLYSSFGMLKAYNKDKTAFFEEIKGNKVVISDVIFKYSNVYESSDQNLAVSGEAPGYMFNSGGEDLFSGYSVPDDGVAINVNGKVMLEYKDVPRALTLNQIVLADGITEIKQAEKDGEDEAVSYYHSMGTITINGDQITEKGESLSLEGGEFSKLSNF